MSGSFSRGISYLDKNSRLRAPRRSGAARVAAPLRASLAGVLALAVLAAFAPTRGQQADPATAATCTLSANAQQPWRTEIFNNGALDCSEAPVVVSSSPKGSGGAYFRATLEPSKRYRLTVAGHATSGAATFRLTRGDSAPEWLSAPDGARETLLIGVAKVEALIYSDSGFSYRLDRLSLEECASCRTEQERADVATAVAPGWAAALYREPSLRVDGDGALAIGGDGGPAGIELRRDGLDPRRAYRVTIAGRGGFGAGMLRIDRDDARSQWIAAPEGVLPLTVSGASWIRLAFYGDAAFDYRLRAVAIETCADCETDSDLKRAIAQALPGIEAEASANPLHAAARLLDWAANDVELGGRIGRFEVLSAALPAMSAGQIHAELWAAHAGGASCGAFAVYYKKILGLFGIPAFTINIGYVDPLTHVTTVLPIATRSGLRFYLFDPTLNGAYRLADGGYASLGYVLGRFHRSLRFAVEPIRRTLMVEQTAVPRLSALFAQIGLTPDCRDVETYRVCARVAYDDRFLSVGWAPLLRAHGIAPDADLILAFLRHGLLHPPEITDAATRDRFLALVRRAEIPVAAP